MKNKGFTIIELLAAVTILVVVMTLVLANSIKTLENGRKTANDLQDVLDQENQVDTFDDIKGVNKPEVVTGMTPVKWNGTSWITTSVNDGDWYDYANKKYANVMMADGSYFVWIPRYAYKITSGHHLATAGSIDVKFLKNTTNESITGYKVLSSGYNPTSKNANNNYFLHPAFTYGTREIKGFWVAKFEATAAEGVASLGSCIAGDNVTTKNVKIIPLARSWRCITAKNVYTSVMNMKNSVLYGWTASEVDPHVLKNTEWGAVAYLSSSQYGKVGEVWQNSAIYQTGCGASALNASSEATCYEYQTALGMNASTTGNITGVYDMSGGNWERLMAISNGYGTDGGFTASEITNMENKYVDRYTTIPGSMLNGVGMDYDPTFYGDGLYETSLNAARYNGSAWVNNQSGAWYGDYSLLTHTGGGWFMRGGVYSNAAFAGPFAFYGSVGTANVLIGFRPAVVIN